MASGAYNREYDVVRRSYARIVAECKQKYTLQDELFSLYLIDEMLPDGHYNPTGYIIPILEIIQKDPTKFCDFMTALTNLGLTELATNLESDLKPQNLAVRGVLSHLFI